MLKHQLVQDEAGWTLTGRLSRLVPGSLGWPLGFSKITTAMTIAQFACGVKCPEQLSGCDAAENHFSV